MKRSMTRAIALLIGGGVAAISMGADAQSTEAYVLPRCPVTDKDQTPASGKAADPLTGLIVQMIIAKGVDIASAALTKAAEDKVTRMEAADTPPLPYYKINATGGLSVSEDIGCLVLIGTQTPGAKLSGWSERLATNLAGMKVATQIDSVPDFYFEARLQRNDSSQGISATAAMLYLKHPLLEGGGWFRKQEKDYVIAASLIDESTDAAFGAISFAFRGVGSNKAWLRSGLGHVSDGEELSAWPAAVAIPKLPVSDAVKEAVSRQKTTIAPYQEANAAIEKHAVVPLEKKAIESVTAYQAAVGNFCKEVAKTNPKSKADEKQSSNASDPRCPLPVWMARNAVDSASSAASKEVTYKWAVAFQQRYCGEGEANAAKKVKDPQGKEVTVTLCKLPAPEKLVQGNFRIRTTVVETAEASKFLKVLASAVAEKKTEITTHLNDEFNPVRREEIFRTEDASARESRQKLQVAMLKVAQLELTYAEAMGNSPSARKATEILLVQAKIDANLAARTAGAASPYPEYD